MNRKIFLKSLGTATVILSTGSILNSCKNILPNKSNIKFIRSGTHSKIGHILKEEFIKDDSYNYKKIFVNTLIVGAGISGLSAGYHLKENNFTDFIIIELDSEVGGNSKSSSNQYSSYPYAAHYLPIPDMNNKPLIDFLYKNKIIESFNQDGLPIYKESYICHSAENRLLENKYWYEGQVGKLNSYEQIQFEKFDEIIQHYKHQKNEQEYIFQIPTRVSSLNEDINKLDTISFKTFLLNNNINSNKLLWYFNYCCLDDFGQGIDKVSAYAGIHYFSARRGEGANCEPNSILTWPEGNNKLVRCLKQNIENFIQTDKIVRHIELVKDTCYSYITNINTNSTDLYVSKNVIIATPMFIRNKILKSHRCNYTPEHQPWLVSTITLNKYVDYNGFGLSWDNIIYEHSTLGFIDAQHQHLNVHSNAHVFTMYKVLDFDTPQQVRKIYYNKTDDDLKNEVIADWLSIYPNSEEDIIEIDTILIAHGMCSPGINYITHPDRIESIKSINKQIHFAHTDYIGISIFEEAFEQGRIASYKIVQHDI